MTVGPLAELPVSRLILWRHGRTAWNAAGRFQGQLDPPLDATGRRQAAAAAPHVAADLSPEDTVVVSSDLDRAEQTAQALTGLLGVRLRLDERLREHGMGSWEGLTRDEVADRFPDQYAAWMAGRPVIGRGGEEPGAVADRAVAALADLPPAAVAVVVTHGGTSGRLIERLLGLTPDHRRVLGPLGNCAWSELAVQGGRWRLLRHNSSVLRQPDRRLEGAGPALPEDDVATQDGAPAADADAV
ncbi:histidine phosphatase family protein [Blastococcus haudaquaticus]|uniref:Probable phosphoglycerate mutase n=1 Tax=Blastococcus haudaquaticus TaxID=1938745 RepID=A0A286H331_9ACTN|nr:histidine phosphatase family protein [Blastococcus haudaquaticus]SOE02208.1 probable phosphoglycerate mutase [Blastococcus haudaquaticus]